MAQFLIRPFHRIISTNFVAKKCHQLTSNEWLFQNHAKSIIEELFPGDTDAFATSASASFESPLLDRLVVAMSTDLIDDFPASDPRWLQTVPGEQKFLQISSFFIYYVSSCSNKHHSSFQRKSLKTS